LEEQEEVKEEVKAAAIKRHFESVYGQG